MNKNKKILFVGSFLSKKKGTQSVAEKISTLLGKYYDISLVSDKENQVFRILDIIYNMLFRKYDLAHIDVFSGKAFIISEVASWIAYKRGKKIVMTLHGGRLSEFYEMNKKRFKILFTRADRIVSPSMFLVDSFGENSILIDYLPNFINIENFKYVNTDNRQHALLWVRAFTDVYHPELAIDTLNELKIDFPDLILNMIGPDKGTIEKIKKYTEELGLTNKVNFLGKVSNEELSQYYQSHAVYLNTTCYESFGLAVVEAAACGIPIVSMSVGEIPYLWKDKENMLICENRSGKEMSSFVSMLLESEVLSKSLSDSARVKAESLDWERVEVEWTKLIEKVFYGEKRYDI